MANLIITIISIALIAVAALMSAYYGGQAYQNAQAKAKANEIINGANQIAGAIQVWKANNMKSAQSFPHWSPPNSSTLISGYLTSIPSVHISSAQNYELLKLNTNAYVARLTNPTAGDGSGSLTAEGELPSPAYVLGIYMTVSTSPPSNVCQEINRISTGSPTPEDLSGMWNGGGNQTLGAVFGTNKFRCVHDNDYPPGEEYFVYRFN